MNLENIITQIEKVDPEIYGRLDGRRQAIKNFTRFAGKVTVASIPIALGTMFKKAYGAVPSTVIEVLNFALTLEYLEASFYEMGNASANLIPAGAEANAFVTIGAHENAHVNLLKGAITAAMGTPVTKPTFDFTAGGNFNTVFSSYDTFLAVSQAFEDTGVRAYKGQAGVLMTNNDVLTVALNIHSVEARHASHVRRLRQLRGAVQKPWITLKSTGGIGAAVQPNYNGEEVTMQGTIEIVGINGQAIDANAASESFDEPLSYDQVIAIVTPFFAV
ncbi:MAG: ferritin-like domain-containing protein [Flavitalea sp.]